MRKARFLVLVLACAGAVPGAASADPFQPRLDDVQPPIVQAGSGDSLFELTGEGFSTSGEPVDVRPDSRVFVNSPTGYEYLDIVVVDEQHAEVIIPAWMLEYDGDMYIRIVNDASVGPVPLFTFASNVQTVDIIPRYVPPVSIEFELNDLVDVGSCSSVSFYALDADGFEVTDAEAIYTIEADDPTTPAPSDSPVGLFSDWGCEEPMDGLNYKPDDEWYPSFSFRADVPQQVVFEVTWNEKGLVGSTDVIAIVGGWLEGRVLTADADPVEGVRVYATYEHYPVFTPYQTPGPISPSPQSFPYQYCYPEVYGGWPYWLDAPTVVADYGYPLIDEDPIAVTDADGSFRSAAIPPDEFGLYFEASFASGQASQWYPASSLRDTAELVDIDNDATTNIGDVALHEGGSITGMVTEAAGGAPLADTLVQILDPSGELVASTTSRVDGAFETPGLDTGSYLVRFFPQQSTHLSEYHPNAAGRDDAEPVEVGLGTTSGISAAVERGAGVHGVLRDGVDGTPVAGIVTLFDHASGAPRARGIAAADGSFLTSPGVRPGEYRMRVDPVLGKHYRSWYEDAPSFAQASPFALGFGEVEQREIDLSRGSVFTGSVHALRPTVGPVPFVRPVASAVVTIHDAIDGELVGAGCAESDGSFRTSGVAPGRYKLLFSGSNDQAPEWYPNASTFEEARVFEVSDGQEVTADAFMDAGGVIGGTISGVEDGAFVYATREGDGFQRAAWAFDGDRDGQGAFELAGLPSGRYRLLARAAYSWNGEGPPDTWYPGTNGPSAAEVIEVSTAGAAITADFAFGEASYFTGRITNFKGADGGRIRFLDPATHDVLASSYTESDGTFTSPALHGGEYILRFDGFDREAARVYHGGARVAAEAEPVTLPPGSVVGDIEAVLPAGRVISGTVRAAHSGALVPLVQISIVDAASGELLAQTYDDPTAGVYSSYALVPGTYKVLFEPLDVFADQWFLGQGSFSTATLVTVTQYGDVAGIDGSLIFSP